MNHYYIVAEEESDTCGNIVIISDNWLTPKKSKALWPNCKLSTQFNKLLQRHEPPREDWEIIRIKRKFFQTEDFMTARKKAKLAENYSDFTEVDDDSDILKKRNRKPTKIISESESEEESALDLFRKTGKESHTRTILSSPSPVTGIVDYNHLNTVANNNILSLASEKDTEKLVNNNTTQALQEIQEVPNSVHAGFQVKVLNLLTTILEQNNQILSWIRAQNDLETLRTSKTPLELPFQLPLYEEKELEDVEHYLNHDDNFTKLCNYLLAFCGNTASASINQIMKHCLTNELASKFSFRGKKGKHAFENLNLKAVIIRAVKKHFKIVVDKKLEDDIKVWLKHAPQRLQKKLLKKVIN